MGREATPAGAGPPRGSASRNDIKTLVNASILSANSTLNSTPNSLPNSTPNLTPSFTPQSKDSMQQFAPIETDDGNWSSAADFNKRKGTSRANTAFRSQAPSVANGLRPRVGVPGSIAPSRGGIGQYGSIAVSRAGTANRSHVAPDYFSTYTHKTFHAGQMIWAPHIVPNLDPNALEDDAEIALAGKMGALCAKFRPMIVLAKFADHLVAVPCFTHKGTGWNHEARMANDNAFYLRSAGDRSKEWDVIDKAKVLVTEHKVKLGAVTYVDKPCVVLYKYQIRTAGERLYDESFQRLLSSHNELMIQGQNFDKQDERLRLYFAKPNNGK